MIVMWPTQLTLDPTLRDGVRLPQDERVIFERWYPFVGFTAA
jgi:hypothetical protein